MSRIVVDPDELKRVAGFIAEAATAYADTASAIRDRDIPEMPPTLTDAITTGLQRAAGRLDELSTRLDGSAFLLRERAAIVDGDAAARVVLEIGRDLNG